MMNFIFILGDGIFDRLENDEIFHKIWKYKKKGEVHNDIRELCGDIFMGFSFEKKSFVFDAILHKCQIFSIYDT